MAPRVPRGGHGCSQHVKSSVSELRALVDGALAVWAAGIQVGLPGSLPVGHPHLAVAKAILGNNVGNAAAGARGRAGWGTLGLAGGANASHCGRKSVLNKRLSPCGMRPCSMLASGLEAALRARQPAGDGAPPLRIWPYNLHQPFVLPTLHRPALGLQQHGRAAGSWLTAHCGHAARTWLRVHYCGDGASGAAAQPGAQSAAPCRCSAPPAPGARRGCCCAAAPRWLAG